MTTNHRPELDAWLAEADAVLDEDCYGRSWETDAMHARFTENGDPDDAGIPYRLSEAAALGWPAPVPREAARYFTVPVPEAERLAQSLSSIWDALAEALRPVAEALLALGASASESALRVPAHGQRPPQPRPVARPCPRHGWYGGTACRVCQREQTLRPGRRR